MFVDDHFAAACDAKYGFSSSGAVSLAADVEAASKVNPFTSSVAMAAAASSLLFHAACRRLRRRFEKSFSGSTRAWT
jgi:hypothetical protein